MSRILNIDDDPGTLDTFSAILRLAGHLPTTAATGIEGLGLARKSTPDLILIDLRLPDMNGIDLINRLALDQIDSPFVIMTGFPSITSAVEAGKLGVADYIAKPIFDNTLLEIVHSHARGATQSAHSSGNNPHVHRALQAIESRFADSALSVGSVAGSINVSVEHRRRLVKQHTGDSFHRILIRTRVTEARRLVETTSLSVKEISGRVGFRDTSHCDHTFRAICRQSPQEYRTHVHRSTCN